MSFSCVDSLRFMFRLYRQQNREQTRRKGLLLDLLLGIVGAMVGGWLFNQFGSVGVTGFNLYSLVVSVIGAILVLVIYHAVRRV